jgi:hypothetical protein
MPLHEVPARAAMASAERTSPAARDVHGERAKELFERMRCSHLLDELQRSGG